MARNQVRATPSPNEKVVPERLWTAAEYAGFTGRTAQAVAHERCRGSGPLFIKVGKRVFYDPAVVRQWLAAHQVTSTAELAA
jgi:hypothetical protein